MRIILFQRGATSWGFQIGRYYAYVPFWRFIRCGCGVQFGIERNDA